MRNLTKYLPYLILTTATVLWWKISTETSNYAWDTKGKELLMLEIALTSIFIHKVLFWVIVGNAGLFAIINSLNRKTVIGGTAAIITICLFVFGGQWINKKLSFSYFTVFNNQSVAEEYIDRPITEGGYYLGNHLVRYVKDRTAARRRYAIIGLGKIKFEPATDVLKEILLDETEMTFIRADAYTALKLIGTQKTKGIIEDFGRSGEIDVLRFVNEWK